MHRGEDTSGEDASGKDTCGEDTCGKVEHSSNYDEHSGDQGGPASGSKLIRVVEEMGTHATDVAGKRHSDGCSQCQRILHQTKRPAVGSRRLCCPHQESQGPVSPCPERRGERHGKLCPVKRDIEFLPNFTDQLALGIWMPLIFSRYLTIN